MKLDWGNVASFLRDEVTRRNFRPNPSSVQVHDEATVKGVFLTFAKGVFGRGDDPRESHIGLVVTQSEWLFEPDDAARVLLLHDKLRGLREAINAERTATRETA